MGEAKKAGNARRPRETSETVRQRITALLEEEGRPMSAYEISGLAGIPEKEVYGHLEHIQKSLNKSDRRFVVTPAGCKSCGFVFKKRGRLKKPGRCPMCKGESIDEPFFSITPDQ